MFLPAEKFEFAQVRLMSEAYRLVCSTRFTAYTIYQSGGVVSVSKCALQAGIGVPVCAFRLPN